MKSKVDKLYVDKLVPGPVKKWYCYKDVYNDKIKNIKDEIPDITNFAADTTLNAKTNEVKGETPSIINLATTTALTTVEKKNS